MTQQEKSSAPHPIDRISKVYVNPQSKIKYLSYYLGGIHQLIGSRNLKFSARPFRDIKVPNEWTAYEHYAALIFETRDGQRIKVAIDFHDCRFHIPEAYEWCDVYAKLNLDWNTLPQQDFPKVVPIAPAAFTRIWSHSTMRWHLAANLLRCGLRPHSGRKRFKRDYEYMSSCMQIEEFEGARGREDVPAPGAAPYVFLVSSLWQHQFCMENTNPWRKRFMESCKELGCDFEGGFFPLEGDNPAMEPYAHLLVKQKYRISDYFSRMTRSLFTFSTPSVHECHGIKLAEYLAMGKAIIATPITNVLPGPGLEHGKSVHIVRTDQELKDGIRLLMEDEAYRRSISEGAMAYYDRHVSPAATVRDLVASVPFQGALR